MRGRDHPDPVIATVGDHQVPRAVDRHGRRGVELGRSSQAAFTRKAELAVAGHGVDVPGGHRQPVEGAGAGRDHPDPAAAQVRDDQVPRVIQRHPAGGQRGAGRWAAITERPGGARAHRRGQPAGLRVYLPHHVGVSDVEAAGVVRDAAQTVLPEPEGHVRARVRTTDTPRDGGDVPSRRRRPDPSTARLRPAASPGQRRRAADTSASTEATAAGRPSPPDRPLFMTRLPQRFPRNPADGYGAN